MMREPLASAESKSWLYHPEFRSEWEHRPLYSMAQWVNGLAFRDIQFSPTGRPVIKIAEMKGGISGQTKFTEQTFTESVHVKPGDMLFSWSGQPETSIDVFWWRGRDGWLNQHSFRVTPGEGVDRAFFYYLLRYLKPNFIGIARNKQTTGLGHVTKRDLERIQAAQPPLPEQVAIASILGALDDKIELNARMNRTLEAMARAIFKSWFVDFDPVRAKMEGSKPSGMDDATAALFPDSFEDSELGPIPKGWSVRSLFDCIDLIGGGTPSTKTPEYWDGDIPWFSVVDAPDPSDVWVIDTEKHITEEGLGNSSTRLLPKGTTIVSARGTVGKCALTALPMAMNQSCYGVRGAEGHGDYYTYFTLRDSIADLQQNTHGSVFDTITRDTFQSIGIVDSSSILREHFENAVSPIMAMLLSNCLESRTLAETRDVLLPKLMSGDISVPQAAEVEAL